MTTDTGEPTAAQDQDQASPSDGWPPRPIVDGRKQCARCDVWKPVAEFHRRAASPDGLHYKCRPCNAAAAREWKQANPERMRELRVANPLPVVASSLRRHYGMTLDEYDERLAQQGGRCAVCRAEPTTRRLAVDHDHDTGRVRGLLCLRCNVALGHMDHDPARARALADYLEGAAS